MIRKTTYCKAFDTQVTLKNLCDSPLIACQPGTYGHNCQDTCGYCLNFDDCYHVNGTCHLGCEPGYKGDICKIGQWFFFFKYLLYFNQTMI